MSLAELSGVGNGTVVGLGRPFSTGEDAEIFAAGIPLARGKVVTLGEEMGIRVTRRRPGSSMRSSRAPAAGSARCGHAEPTTLTPKRSSRMTTSARPISLPLKRIRDGYPASVAVLTTSPASSVLASKEERYPSAMLTMSVPLVLKIFHNILQYSPIRAFSV